ncbi:hypothetical protein FACS189481_6200 [Clostridia bacterium]|nr:hypothetical protein FACS189481_6200 [Clostridia bacterium]
MCATCPNAQGANKVFEKSDDTVFDCTRHCRLVFIGKVKKEGVIKFMKSKKVMAFGLAVVTAVGSTGAVSSANPFEIGNSVFRKNIAGRSDDKPLEIEFKTTTANNAPGSALALRLFTANFNETVPFQPADGVTAPDFGALIDLAALHNRAATLIRQVYAYWQEDAAAKGVLTNGFVTYGSNSWKTQPKGQLGLGKRARWCVRHMEEVAGEAKSRIVDWGGGITEGQATNQLLKEVADALVVLDGRAKTAQEHSLVLAAGDYLHELITGDIDDFQGPAQPVGEHWQKLTQIDPATCVPVDMSPLVKTAAGKQVLAVLRDFV